MPVLGFYILIRLLHDLFKDWQLYIAKPLNINTDPAGGMFAHESQQFCVAHGPIHQVNGYLTFSWIKANRMTVTLTPTVVFVVVGIKPNRSLIPYLWLMTADSLHHFNQHKGILDGLLVIKRRNIVFD